MSPEEKKVYDDVFYNAIMSSSIEYAEGDGWRILAKNAELNEPSEQSKQRIVELLKGARLG